MIAVRHSNVGNNHQLQIASSYAENGRLFFRKVARCARRSSSPGWNRTLRITQTATYCGLYTRTRAAAGACSPRYVSMSASRVRGGPRREGVGGQRPANVGDHDDLHGQALSQEAERCSDHRPRAPVDRPLTGSPSVADRTDLSGPKQEELSARSATTR